MLADGLWYVHADLPSLPIGRAMTVARTDDGGLAVHSAVCCDAKTMDALDALGPVRWIIVPNGYHRMDAPRFKARYPEARVVAMPASRARVAQAVTVDGDHTAFPGGGAVTWQPLAGMPKEGVMIHRDGGRAALVFNDAFMNLPERLPGFKGMVVKMLGSLGGPKVTRTARFALVADRKVFADELRRLADTPGLTTVVPGHGAVIREGAPEALRRAADGLHRG